MAAPALTPAQVKRWESTLERWDGFLTFVVKDVGTASGDTTARDELIPLKEIRKFYGQLDEPKELVVIDAADHLFDGKASEVGEAVEDLLQDFNG